MNSKINKIQLSIENGKLIGLVVVRNNSTKVYGYNDSKQDLMKIYSNNIMELKKDYINELKNLNPQDAINQLYLLGKIEYISKDKVSEIYNIYDEELENILKENKIKNFQIRNKSIILSLLIGTIAVTGMGFESIRSFFKRNENDESNLEPQVNNTTVIPKVTEDISLNKTPDIEIKNTFPVMESITPPPTLSPEERNNIVYEEKSKEEFFNDLVTARFYGIDFYIFKDDKKYASIGRKGTQPDNACLNYSRSWVSDYMNGTTSFKDSGLTFYGVATENKQIALQVIGNEIMEGRPVVIRVNGEQDFYKGKKKSSRRHFVVVCGIRKGADLNNLKESDFLIYDPTYNKRFKVLGSHAGGGTNDRKLLKTEQNSGWKGAANYSDGYYLEIYSDSSEYLEMEDVYEGKIKS